MKKLVQSLFILLCIAVSAYGQDGTVTGIVTSTEDGLLMSGASIKVKDAPSIGISSEAKRRFTPENS
jgi:hypothetical protein